MQKTTLRKSSVVRFKDDRSGKTLLVEGIEQVARARRQRVRVRLRDSFHKLVIAEPEDLEVVK